MFDKVKFYQAVALLKSFKANLPRDSVDLAQVDDYHKYLNSLQEQVGVPLSEFRIPQSAIKTVVPQRIQPAPFNRFNRTSQSQPTYQYCVANVFRRQLDALILFIDTYLDELKSDLRKS